MKIRSVFRTKSSLEVEMRRVLEDSNASLTAFVINNFEYRKIPHSAFHSLEYTHMRTILSQLNDSSWFKTFSDLTDCEHDTLSAIVGKHYTEGEIVNRELVVLKVLRRNRINAWVRLVEYAMRTHNFLPQFENYRIVLAIVREKKECGPRKKTPIPPLISNSHDKEESLPRPALPQSVFDQNSRRLSDLGMSGERNYGRRPPLGGFTSPPLGPPPGPPPPPWESQGRSFRASIPSPDETVANSLDGKNLSTNAVQKALTTYTAFTLRKAPPQTTLITTGQMFYPNEVPWMRCLVTREIASTADLKRRISEFVTTGLSIIDMKFELTDMQASHLTILFNELAADEIDTHFEHSLVELSLVNREKGLLVHQQGSDAEIIHVIVRRAPKEGTGVVDLYKKLMSPPVPLPLRPYDGPLLPPGVTMGWSTRKGKPRFRKSSVSRHSSDSESVSVDSSRSSDSDSDSEEEEVKRVRRWARDDDPTILKFERKVRDQDVVQCLLDMWTVNPHDEKECN